MIQEEIKNLKISLKRCREISQYADNAQAYNNDAENIATLERRILDLEDAVKHMEKLKEFANGVLTSPKDIRTMSLALSLGLINEAGLKTKILE
jgi:hypothetical protein